MFTAVECLDYGDAIADWLLDLAEESLRREELETALEFITRAASILSRQNRRLSHPRMETLTHLAAQRLPTGGPIARQKPARETCLHVISEALPAGGHTAMATRWMLNDQSGRRHCVALLRQGIPVPEGLREAVQARGGEVFSADAESSQVERAVWLRKLAYASASQVVLHVDVSEVISNVAFGLNGGPPVMLVNHAAHVFWMGGSVMDLVLNCRGSELEEIWARKYRGVPRSAILPIPLVETVRPVKSRAQTRAELGIAADATVFITIGAAFKYQAANGLDFVRTCEEVLNQVPDSILLAIGFSGDARWQTAAERTGNRIRTLGRKSQAELAELRQAADLYLEGFPFGTTTSLLESAQSGLPVVLASAQSPPPYGSDGVALDNCLARPDSVAAFVTESVRLAKDSLARKQEAEAVRDSVCRHHTGEGWRRHLDAAITALPKEHAVYAIEAHEPTPKAIHEYWTHFQFMWDNDLPELLENELLRAYRNRCKPRLPTRLIAGCQQAKQVRAGRTIPLPVLTWLCNRILPWTPTPLDRWTFRAVAFLCRGDLVGRLGRRWGRWLGRAPVSQGAYAEYRQSKVSRS